MTYTIAGGNSFNMVFYRVGRSDPTTWDTANAITDMRFQSKSWDSHHDPHGPKASKTTCLLLRINLQPTSRITRSSYSSQDGAALAEALSHVHFSTSLPFPPAHTGRRASHTRNSNTTSQSR
ncbi:hypothetical protein BDV97DRAFT_370476 [Delphinella strobiligena]|nr:hypothetical protein BDV97DRAFT_370476 [Delphinella strobiligena]